MVQLPDIKARKKQAKLEVELSWRAQLDARGRIPAGSLRLVPFKGKRILWLLGRDDFRSHAARQLEAGDVFGVGRSLLRVIYVGVLRDGKLEVSEDKGTKFRREETKAEKRRCKLEAQQVDEEPADAEGEGEGAPAAAAAEGEVAGEEGGEEAEEAAAAEAEGEEGEGEDGEEEAYGDEVDEEMLGLFEADGLHARRAFKDEAAPERVAPFIHLLAISGPYRKREFVLGNAPSSVGPPLATLGSSAANDVALPQDESVSPLHARLQLFSNAWWLSDCASENGTWLLVEDAGRPFDLGDRFRAARCEMQLLGLPELAAT